MSIINPSGPSGPSYFRREHWHQNMDIAWDEPEILNFEAVIWDLPGRDTKFLQNETRKQACKCCKYAAHVVQMWCIRKIQNHPSPSCATFMTDSMISLVSADGLPLVSGFVQWCPYVNHGESPNSSSSRPQTECSSPKCWHWISLRPIEDCTRLI